MSSAHSSGSMSGGGSKYSSGSKGHRHNTSVNSGPHRDRSEQRSFMYCKYLHHPGLASIQYKSFFHTCRLESISFDLERRQGATFML